MFAGLRLVEGRQFESGFARDQGRSQIGYLEGCEYLRDGVVKDSTKPSCPRPPASHLPDQISKTLFQSGATSSVLFQYG